MIDSSHVTLRRELPSLAGLAHRSLAALLVLGAQSSCARAASPAPAPPPAAHAPKQETVAADASDSLARVLRAPGGFQRVMTRADSVVQSRGGSRAENAQLYPAWNAPWGSRRSTRSRMPACSDSTVEDTLLLSVRLGRDAEHFNGFTCELVFHATGADSLGPWWHMEGKGGKNPGSLRMEWAGSPDFSWPQPFRSAGQGFVILDRTPSRARFRMVFAVPFENSGAVDGDSLYTLCRVILKHRPDRALAGCDRPVCVEWASATLAFGPKDEPRVARGERFVSYSAPATACEPFTGPRVPAWKPKTQAKR